MNKKLIGTKRVVVFSGANSNPQYEQEAYSLGYMIAKNGYTLVNGGGPGIMEHVRRGAYMAGGKSYGVCIRYAKEREYTYMDAYETHNTIDKRQEKLIDIGHAFIVLPGGLGTLAEAVMVTQRKKFLELPFHAPLIFYGSYYENLLHYFDEIDEEGFVSESIPQLYSFARTIDDVEYKLRSYFQIYF